MPSSIVLLEKPIRVISYDGPPIKVAEGHVYQAVGAIYTRSGFVFEPGDLLVVVKKTLDTPHGEISEVGYNWVCTTRHSTTVWATLESCIARCLFQRIK